MNDITIPDEVVEAAAKEIASTCRCEMACDWRDHIEDARAAILAGLKAWPGVALKTSGRVVKTEGDDEWFALDTLILPLPTQETDA